MRSISWPWLSNFLGPPYHDNKKYNHNFKANKTDAHRTGTFYQKEHVISHCSSAVVVILWSSPINKKRIHKTEHTYGFSTQTPINQIQIHNPSPEQRIKASDVVGNSEWHENETSTMSPPSRSQPYWMRPTYTQRTWFTSPSRIPKEQKEATWRNSPRCSWATASRELWRWRKQQKHKPFASELKEEKKKKKEQEERGDPKEARGEDEEDKPRDVRVFYTAQHALPRAVGLGFWERCRRLDGTTRAGVLWVPPSWDWGAGILLRSGCRASVSHSLPSLYNLFASP